MQWLQISIALHHEALEAATEILLRQGVTGVEIDDPRLLLERHAGVDAWDYVELPEGFDAGAEAVVRAWILLDEEAWDTLRVVEQELRRLPELGLQLGSGTITAEVIEDQNWSETWKAYYKPLRIGERLVIKPVWEEWPHEGDVVVELDPGLAFGTGSHATTRMCLILLERCLRTGDAVIDVGCGSGILSVAAAKLGAGRVEAIDIDPLAVSSTKANLSLNGLSDRVLVRHADLLQYSGAVCDLVLANIVADVILRLLGDIARVLKPGGIIIVSGIITERRDEIESALISAGFQLLEALVDGDWLAIAARRK